MTELLRSRPVVERGTISLLRDFEYMFYFWFLPSIQNHRASQVVLVVKNLLASVRDVGLIPGLGRSLGGGHGSPLQYSCLENPMERGSLRGSSPWGHKELDTSKVTAFMT